MDGRHDRSEEGETPPPSRSDTRLARMWEIVRSGLLVAELVAGAEQHETPTTWVVRVIVVLGDIGVRLCNGRRR